MLFRSVVDPHNRLVGRVTVAEAVDVIREEGESAALASAGLREDEDLFSSVWQSARNRWLWLAVNLCTAFFASRVIGAFEGTIERVVALAALMPIVAGIAGNSGNQTMTLIIRALALEEITLGDWWRVMSREILSGLSLGTILGTIGFLCIAIWSAFSNMYGPHWFLVALTVGFSLVGIVLWGTLSGSMLPFILRRLGFDPATSSAPFVATLVDVTGLIIYFTVALIVLGK